MGKGLMYKVECWKVSVREKRKRQGRERREVTRQEPGARYKPCGPDSFLTGVNTRFSSRCVSWEEPWDLSPLVR